MLVELHRNVGKWENHKGKYDEQSQMLSFHVVMEIMSAMKPTLE